MCNFRNLQLKFSFFGILQIKSKVRDFANLCIHSNSLLLHPSLYFAVVFLWKTSKRFSHIFAKRPQGLCKICCGNLPAVAADISKSFGFEKSK